jgi:hypothetical protein
MINQAEESNLKGKLVKKKRWQEGEDGRQSSEILQAGS